MKDCIFIISTIFVMVFISCQEFLPPRDDPNEYFSIETSVEYDVNVALKRNQLVIFLKIANTSDETIEDRVKMNGTVAISWLPDTENETYPFVTQRTFHIGNANIIKAKGYDRNTQILRIDPGDTMTVACFWNFKTDDSTYLFNYFDYELESRCKVIGLDFSVVLRKILLPKRFKVTAALKLSDRTSFFYFPSLEFEKCFVYPYQAEDTITCLKTEGISDYCKLIK